MPPAFPTSRRASRLAEWVRAVALAGMLAGPAAVGACTSPAPLDAPPRVIPAGWRLEDESAVRPTLEEIFLAEPPFGEPPEIESVAADALHALVRWRDRAAGEERASLRLVAAFQPDGARGAGRPLAELLPPPVEGESTRLVTAWSNAGHRLAVARGTTVWLIEPRGAGSAVDARMLATWEAPEGAAEPDEDELDREADAEPEVRDADASTVAATGDATDLAQEPDAALPPSEDPPTLAFGRVRSLAFLPNDAALRMGDGDELVELSLAPREPDAAPLTPGDGAWISRDVASPARRLTWSDDHAVVFGDDPAPRPELFPELQVWRLDEQRGVALEGWDEDADYERPRLSPDGAHLVATESDDAGEPDPVEIPDYLTTRVTHRSGRRNLADDRPSPERVWVWDTSTGARFEIDLGAPLPCEPPPPRAAPEGEASPPEAPAAPEPIEPIDHVRVLGWSRATDGPPTLAIERVSEDYRTSELWTWRAGELARRVAQHDAKWLGSPGRFPRWSADGDALFFGSETHAATTTPGRAQLFRLDVARGEVRQLTAVKGELKDFTPLEDGGVLVLASGANPARNEYLFLDRDAARGVAGTRPVAYPAPNGGRGRFDDGSASRDGRRLFARYETLLGPAEVVVAELGGSAHVLTETVPPGFSELGLEPPRKLAVRAPDGADVHAHVYLPPYTSLEGGGPPRATIVFVHGAGYLQNVTDGMTRYPLNALFHVRLARLGYVVVDVDYRGSAGYGGRFRGDVQYHLGGKDLDDIHLVVDELIERGLVDARRVGLYGGSYGGFLTMMALFTAPERWSVGAALRSVTDWRTYHPGYTVPRLGRPSTHPDAYAISSPIDLVDGLADPLLVLHGMMDSNVFAQDSIRLIEALIDKGKEFDAMLYPSQNHAFEDGEHWLDEYKRIERYLIEHLGPPLLFEDGGADEWADADWIDERYVPCAPEPPGSRPTRDSGGVDLGRPFRAVGGFLGDVVEGAARLFLGDDERGDDDDDRSSFFDGNDDDDDDARDGRGRDR